MCAGKDPLLRVCYISIARRYTYVAFKAYVAQRGMTGEQAILSAIVCLSYCASEAYFRLR
jgi:hypothetical protein